jgi:DNA-binding NtrC family response regulator
VKGVLNDGEREGTIMSDRAARPTADEPGPAGHAPTRRQTILLADDDAAVRRIVVTILERHGYPVLSAEDGDRVVEAYAAFRGQVALVILDQRMPGPGLEATLASLRAIEPATRVLLMSGYTELEVQPETRRLLRGFLGKPFRSGELLHAVESALAGP